MEWGGEATGSRLLANTIWSAFHVLVLPFSSWRIVESLESVAHISCFRRIEHLECYRWCRWKARECATWMDALIRRVRFVRGVCARFAQRIRCLYLMRLQGGHVHFAHRFVSLSLRTCLFTLALTALIILSLTILSQGRYSFCLGRNGLRKQLFDKTFLLKAWASHAILVLYGRTWRDLLILPGTKCIHTLRCHAKC